MSIIKILSGILIVAVLVLLGWLGYQTYLAPVPATPTPERSLIDEPVVISAEGRITPDREARLAFQSGGLVSEVLVGEGDRVDAGDLLVRLDPAERQAAVDQAQGALDAALAQRDLVPDDAEEAQRDLADAQIAQAEAALTLAQATLDQAELRAPFAGTVAAVEIEVGEVAPPGVALVVVVDMSRWHVETLDLSEEDVLALRIGQPAEVRVPAAEGRVLTGSIARIDLSASQYQGNVTYTIVVDLDPTDLALSWGMTAFVDVDPAQAGEPDAFVGAAAQPTVAATSVATSTAAAARPTATVPPAATVAPTSTARPTSAASRTPAPSPTPEEQIHVVARGENLSRIADQYGVSVNDILQANGLTTTTIVTGQRLVIPTPAVP
jgi:multidrug efflux pump subunit AcrA (membrane-fusion protein)